MDKVFAEGFFITDFLSEVDNFLCEKTNGIVDWYMRLLIVNSTVIKTNVVVQDIQCVPLIWVIASIFLANKESSCFA